MVTEDTQLTAEERAEIARRGVPQFIRHNRRTSWALELAERGIAWVEGSHLAKHALLRHVFPDLFTHRRHNPYARDECEVELAIEQLGESVVMRCTIPTGHGQAKIKLRVAGSTEAAARKVLADLGIATV